MAIEKDKRVIPCVYNRVLSDLVPDIIEGLERITFKSGYDLARQVLVLFIPPDVVARQTPLAIDAINVGIARIFKNRRFSPELDDVLKNQISNAKEDILILGNALWSFFGEDEGDKKVIYKEATEKALNNGTNFRVMLLDPLSEAAKERAKIEHGGLVEFDDVYIKSELFKDISRITMWLYNPPAHLKDNMDKQIEVRYTTMTPIGFIIKTDTHTFIEQYHLGSLDAIRTPQTYHAYCLGGYVPFFMVENNQPWARLMQSHFFTIWDEMENNTLPNVYGDIERFKGDPKKFRTIQALDYINERGRLEATFIAK